MNKTYILTLLIFGVIACGTSKEAVEEPHEEVLSEKVEEVKNNTNTQQNSIPETVPVNRDQNNFSFDNTQNATGFINQINWVDFEEAIALNEKYPKYIFIDIYTEWCGWCKKMDASTFKDPKVVDFIKTHCYAVKMDAEAKEPIAFKGNLYEYKQYNQKSGYNTLAVSLLDSQLSFPSFVILNKRKAKVGKIMGYKSPSDLIAEMKKFIK